MSQCYACPRCLRRSWLLGLAAPYIERALSPASSRGILELLSLSDEELVQVIAPEVASTLLLRVASHDERHFAQRLEAAGCWATCRHDRFYPESLSEVRTAPAALIGRGNPRQLLDLKANTTAAIGGARHATAYGREVARALGHDLSKAGLTVISGLAFGAEACTQRGALEAGATIAVLGSGADVPFPASNRSLWQRIAEHGLVVSELPPGTGAWRWTIAARNRVTAGLAGVTVMVEAAERSGSLIAADFADRFERKVGAVPGPVTSRASAGTNHLLMEGAHVIRDAKDVEDILDLTWRQPGSRW